MNFLHVGTMENAADLLTKVKPLSTYISNPFWLKGPKFLQHPNKDWMIGKTMEEIVKQKGLINLNQKEIQKEIKRQSVVMIMNPTQMTPTDRAQNIVQECLPRSRNLTK